MTKRGPYKQIIPGSIADLVDKFRRSPRYNNWAESSRSQRDRIIGDFVARNGRVQVSALRRGNIIEMRDDLAMKVRRGKRILGGPDAANNWLKVIRLLLAYAVDIDMVPVNVAANVERVETPNPDGLRTWREDEIAQYLAYFDDPYEIEHRVFVLALCTGAARSDLVKLGWLNVRGDRFVYRRQKTRRKTQIIVDIPILPQLAAMLETIPRTQETFLEGRQGMRSEKALGTQFAHWVAEAGLAGLDENGKTLSLHGLRKALARRLAEAGAAPQEIMAVLGHATITQAAHYSKAYDRARSADVGLSRIGEPVETNVVRLERKERES